ncbi:aldehyde dehydrogenase family protein [Agrobacterium rhizogenes]|uniref:aldehyde dehydrogenase family protein n=1 Tax=Rhizobium rhizogenes TaxID=359 RepID=UPI000DDF7E24|nr:aldehyde dehydrogenase family protein [Rhizobium rhizogenes]NTH15014.1 aldehyde dehydrogenase family protein [Rhizobium rhizogenes]NTH79929.1 aldehyde dehydrogenase family protein [Rhizobium rhizogenes]NTH85906.1 aldehyde dehydrogenase family protein [Rhizobium rhizogenes]NTI76747.1 aldehyde dehydrogenase family protein [Rhizobium rhizogenes]
MQQHVQPGALVADPYGDFSGQYIAGRWVPGTDGKTSLDRNPFNDDVVAEISLASIADLDLAFEAAHRAQTEWAKTLPAERVAVFLRAVAILDARRDEIIGWIVRESGSTRIKAGIEWGAVRAGMLEAVTLPTAAQGHIIPVDRPGKEARVYKKPVGVVGVISPWNFPLHLSNRSVAPAIALGNAVVLKPSNDTPVTGGLLLAKIYEEAGLPAGVLNVVVGSSDTIGDAFSRHPVPRVLTFTGSTPVGRHIARIAAESPLLKRVGLELGGNAPLVVLDDADLGKAVEAALIGRFMHQGQICMSTNRIIVDASLYDRFVEAYTEAAKTVKYGDPDQPDTLVGPLCNDSQLRNVRASIEQARAAGFRECLAGAIDGRVVPPHVFANVTNDSDFARREIFGPVAPLIRATNEAEALAFANDTEFGLSSAVFTGNEARGLAFAQRIEAGMTHINDITIHDYPHVMFGGEKNSGLGRFNGKWIVEEFTTDHFVSIQR